ncbi:hypothetical protein D3C74_405690 [compost metagenome]
MDFRVQIPTPCLAVLRHRQHERLNEYQLSIHGFLCAFNQVPVSGFKLSGRRFLTGVHITPGVVDPDINRDPGWIQTQAIPIPPLLQIHSSVTVDSPVKKR